jgi:hypothetical protein
MIQYGVELHEWKTALAAADEMLCQGARREKRCAGARQNGPPLAIDTFGGQRISMDDLTGRSRLRCKVIAIGDTTKPL